MTTKTKRRIVGAEAFAALQERKAKAGDEVAVLEIGGKEFTLVSFAPAAIMIDMSHHASEGDIRGALDSLANAFVEGDREALLELLGPTSETPVDMEYISDLIEIVATELTGRPLESE